MNKKVVYSIALIVIIAGMAIAGTYAYLSATRTTSANRFAQGTLDLDVSSNGNKLEPFVIENMGETGNISGTKSRKVKNTGTLPGRFLLRLQNVVSAENGRNDQEKMAEAGCEANNQGELGDAINLKIALDGVDKVSSTLSANQQSAIGAAWTQLDPIVLGPNEEKTLTAYWSADENSYGNEVQGDDVKFDLNFRLIQMINGQMPEN